MKRFVVSFGLATSLLSVSSAQSTTSGPKFDVASVRPGDLEHGGVGQKCTGGPGSPDPETYRCPCKPLGFLIMLAYKVDLTEFDGPPGLKTFDTCFDILAKVPPGATKDQFRLMLQNLLAERFHLSVHHEARTLHSSALMVGKGGPKLKAVGESASAGPSADGTPSARNLATDPPWTVSQVGDRCFRLTAKRMELKALAGFLESVLQTPVEDETGLIGLYEFTLDFLPPGYPSAGESDVSRGDEDCATDIYSALQRQLGLKLNAAQKLSRDMLVVDHVDEAPTAN